MEMETGACAGCAHWAAVAPALCQSAQLRQAPVSIQAPPASYLGEEAGNQVWISPNAAGGGWNLDARAPTVRMDLRSVLDHESGHVLGGKAATTFRM